MFETIVVEVVPTSAERAGVSAMQPTADYDRPRPAAWTGANNRLGAPGQSWRALASLCGVAFGFAALPASAQSSAYIEQVGSSSVAEVTQQTLANEVHIAQTGIGEHVARLDQRGGSTATVEQEGLGHRLAGFSLGIADPNAFAMSFDGSQLVLRQIGGENSQAFVDQRDGAFAEILQFGSDNSAYVLQSGGLGNQAFIDQADGGVAQITQAGTNNIARITQTGSLP